MTIESLARAEVPGDLVSPELVLIDPQLAAHARAALVDPGDTLERLKSFAQAHDGLEVPQQNGLSAGMNEPSVAAIRRLTVVSEGATSEELGGGRPRVRLRLVLLAATVPALALVALLAASWANDTAPPATVSATAPIDVAPTEPTAPISGAGSEGQSKAPSGTARDRAGRDTSRDGSGSRAKARPESSTRPTESGARSNAPRLLAWAPVAGAEQYHVELFDGAARVFSANTRRPRISIPTSWRFEGRMRRLSPGTYLWYVWPVVSGRQSTQAIVRARLDVAR